MPGEKSAISIRALSKSFGKIKAVNKISLEVPGGEVFALLGPNGAGKTTTISMLCGLLEPTAGRALVAGYDVQREPLKVRQEIGVVFQQPSVDDLLSGRENLEMHALLYGMPREGRNERIDDMLELVGLTTRQGSRIKEYSGGMRKRLEIARGILHRPKILFLDEPTTGLDPQARRNLWDFIGTIHKEGRTIVLTTHYMEEAQLLCQRVAIMDKGKVIALDTPNNLVRGLPVPYEVKVMADGPMPQDNLAALDAVKGVEFDADGACRLRSADSVRTLQALLAWANGKGIRLAHVEVVPANLEDVFLALTGHQLRD